jgi:3-hydroxybenzoate 6-monooxygenase
MFDCLGLTEAINKVAYFPAGLRMNGVRSGEKVVWIPLGAAALAAMAIPTA